MTRWPLSFTAYLLLHQVWGHDPEPLLASAEPDQSHVPEGT